MLTGAARSARRSLNGVSLKCPNGNSSANLFPFLLFIYLQSVWISTRAQGCVEDKHPQTPTDQTSSANQWQRYSTTVWISYKKKTTGRRPYHNMCYKSSRIIIAGNRNRTLNLAAWVFLCVCVWFFLFCCCCFLGNEERKGRVIVTRGRKYVWGPPKIKSLPLRRRHRRKGGKKQPLHP